jgi:hypothetical protein
MTVALAYDTGTAGAPIFSRLRPTRAPPSEQARKDRCRYEVHDQTRIALSRRRGNARAVQAISEAARSEGWQNSPVPRALPRYSGRF